MKTTNAPNRGPSYDELFKMTEAVQKKLWLQIMSENANPRDAILSQIDLSHIVFELIRKLKKIDVDYRE